jgi:hypothetical protein
MRSQGRYLRDVGMFDGVLSLFKSFRLSLDVTRQESGAGPRGWLSPSAIGTL